LVFFFIRGKVWLPYCNLGQPLRPQKNAKPLSEKEAGQQSGLPCRWNSPDYLLVTTTVPVKLVWKMDWADVTL